MIIPLKNNAPYKEVQKQSVAHLLIQRGVAGETAQIVQYDVPFEPGQSVLDGLRWIRTHVDASLAFRYSCINANACKECMMQLNGQVIYACTARLVEGQMHLHPLSNKDLIRDLVSEIAPPAERLFGIPPQNSEDI
jgi:succinate dehydrogenase/fumarate reductase-like Fe-S protein